MIQNKIKKISHKEVGEAALKLRIDKKDWASAAAEHRNTLKSVVFELGRLEYPCIDPEISMLRESKTRYVVTVEGWNSEVDAAKLKSKFLNPATRIRNMECITGIRFNPESSTVTAIIDVKLLHMVKTRDRDQRRNRRNGYKRTMTYYDQEQGGNRNGHVRSVRLRDDIDMGNVIETHRASVTDVLVGIFSYQDSMPRTEPPLITAPVSQSFYKIIIKGMQKEFNIKEICNRMLGSRHNRDSHFGLVQTVGFDPRIDAFIVRIAKLKPIQSRDENVARIRRQRRRQ